MWTSNHNHQYPKCNFGTCKTVKVTVPKVEPRMEISNMGYALAGVLVVWMSLDGLIGPKNDPIWSRQFLVYFSTPTSTLFMATPPFLKKG